MSRLTIEQAISHAIEVAEKNKANCERNTIVIPNRWISDAQCAEEHEQLAEWLEELKHHKQLEETGRLKKLPCAVGDILYDLNKEFVVREISLWEDDCDLYALNIKIEDWKENFEMITSEDIGETVFLTKEEAEAKLAEMEGEL